MNFVLLSNYQLLSNFVLFGHSIDDLCLWVLYSVVGVRFRFVLFNSFFVIWNLRYCFLFLRSILFNGRGLMLFVNSDMALRYFVCYYAVHCGSSYVVSRWISGFLTNFYHFIRLSNKGMFLGLFGSFFVGVRFLRRLPSFIFVSDVLHNSYVLNEACRLHIPICGVIDSNFSGLCFSFPIPGNDDSFRSVVFLNAVVSRCILLCKLSRLRFFVRLV